MDKHVTIQQQARALVSRMTLSEKLAQMNLRDSMDLFDGDVLNEERAAAAFGTDGIGALLFPRNAGWTAAQCANAICQLHRFFEKTMRVYAPPFVVEEALHGVMFSQATVFPQSIAMASTWNEELVGQMADVISQEAGALGVTQVLCPDLDLCREPRWGRIEETFGEDAHLTSRLGAAYVKALQKMEDGACHGVAATLKHFAVHGTPEGGINLAPVQAGERLMQEYYLAPFRNVIRDAAPISVMPAYSEIDGIPCSASRRLLTDILRGELGFDGYTISDFGAIEMLMSFHHTADSRVEAGRQALRAGLDLEAPMRYCYDDELMQAAERGEVPLSQIDLAVERILTAKLRARLFEKTAPSPQRAGEIVGCAAHRELSYRAAAESIVLLENRNRTLPLSKSVSSVAVIGPNADTWQLGDYTSDRPCKTPLAAIRERVGKDTEVLYARGCGLYERDESGICEAAALARRCEVAIVCVGGSSTINYGIGWGQDVGKAKTCGEGFDVSDLGLCGVQQRLVEAVIETGTPTVVVHIDGRPASTAWIASHCAALLELWYGGQESADALAAVLFGDENPSGRLPVSIPASVGQTPAYYNHKPSGRGYYHQPGAPDRPGRDYVFSSPAPLYPFGYGLSYTSFSYSALEASYDAENACIFVSVLVKNTGDRAGKEVVAVYLRDDVASVTRPVRELKAFEKIFLEPGQERRVALTIPRKELAFLDENYKWVVETGVFSIFAADQEVKFVLNE